MRFCSVTMVGLVLSLVMIPGVRATEYVCRAVGLAGEGVSDREEIETYAGFAEIRPENQFDVVIDTDAMRIVMRDTILAMEELADVKSVSGKGFRADIPSVGGTVLVRYRDTDDFFAVIMGGYTVAGSCVRP